MKLRKAFSVVAIAAALVVGGASSAAAYHPDPITITAGSTISVAHLFFNPQPGLLDNSNLPAGLSSNLNAAGEWTVGHSSHWIATPHTQFLGLAHHSGQLLTEGVEYTMTPGSTVITLQHAYLANLNEGTHTFVALFHNGTDLGYVDHTVPINIVIPANRGVNNNNEVRAQHPATGPAALLYGVGGLLAAGAGVSLVASSKRRKAELV